MEPICIYRDRRDEILVAYLYNEIDPPGREAFETHLTACAACRQELGELGVVRDRLAQWTPPEPALPVPMFLGGPDRVGAGGPDKVRSTSGEVRQPSRWARLAEIPAWAQVAAAMLFLGVSAAVANLQITYDAGGLSVRTGWMPASAPAVTRPSTESTPPSSATPWRAELTALEAQLRNEMRSSTTPSAAPASASTVDADAVLRRVRALIDESEQRQQRELALRIAEVDNSVRAQRVADLRNIDRNLNVIQSNTGVDMRRLYQMTNELAVRVSQTR
jgi:hypothetical protein